MAYEAIAKMNAEGLVSAKAKEDYSDADLFKAYRKSVAKGILKVMSKMGISTLQSYKGAQVRLPARFRGLVLSFLPPAGTTPRVCTCCRFCSCICLVVHNAFLENLYSRF